MSIMRVDSRELPLFAIPLYQLLLCHLGPPRLTLSINLYVKMSKAVLTAPLEHSTCPYQLSLLSFRMRYRSSMPSRASSPLDLVVTMSCGLTLQICLITVFLSRFVCVEVLRPSQPNGVMSSAVSLPNHTFTG